MKKIVLICFMILGFIAPMGGEADDWYVEHLDLKADYSLKLSQGFRCGPVKIELVEIKEIPVFECCGGVIIGEEEIFVTDIQIYKHELKYPVREILRKVNWWPIVVKSEPVAGGDATR